MLTQCVVAGVCDFWPAHEERGFEIMNTIHVLNHLGYWPEPLESISLNPETLVHAESQRKDLVKKINESIYTTQIMVH